MKIVRTSGIVLQKNDIWPLSGHFFFPLPDQRFELRRRIAEHLAKVMTEMSLIGKTRLIGQAGKRDIRIAFDQPFGVIEPQDAGKHLGGHAYFADKKAFEAPGIETEAGCQVANL